jgi:hypothetical protein
MGDATGECYPDTDGTAHLDGIAIPDGIVMLDGIAILDGKVLLERDPAKQDPGK